MTPCAWEIPRVLESARQCSAAGRSVPDRSSAAPHLAPQGGNAALRGMTNSGVSSLLVPCRHGFLGFASATRLARLAVGRTEAARREGQVRGE